MDQPTPEQQQLLQQARIANLLKIWASGRRQLTAAEMEEIRHLLPAQPSEPIEPMPTNSGEAFALQGGASLPPKLRNFYLHKYEAYAGVYGVDLRTLKRWVKIGKEAAPPDLPPLDERGQMADWFRRHYPPSRLPAALQAFEDARPPVVAALAETLPVSNAPVSGELRPQVLSEKDHGSSVAVQRSASIEDLYWRLQKDALERGDLNESKKWRAEYSEQAELTNKLRRQDREERKATGDLIARGPVLAELAQFLETLRLSRSVMTRKILSELEKKILPRHQRILKIIAPLLVEGVETIRKREDDLLQNIELATSKKIAADLFELAA